MIFSLICVIFSLLNRREKGETGKQTLNLQILLHNLGLGNLTREEKQRNHYWYWTEKRIALVEPVYLCRSIVLPHLDYENSWDNTVFCKIVFWYYIREPINQNRHKNKVIPLNLTFKNNIKIC